MNFITEDYMQSLLLQNVNASDTVHDKMRRSSRCVSQRYVASSGLGAEEQSNKRKRIIHRTNPMILVSVIIKAIKRK